MIRHAINVVRSYVHEAKKRGERSTSWPRIERAFKAEYPTCAFCGGTKRLQVHHEKPFHLFPDDELKPSNLITLCMGPNECHLRGGHGLDFKCYNPNVRADAAEALAHPERLASIFARAKAARLR